MAMTRAEEAQALHGVAVLLENDSEFHERYKQSLTACGRRQLIRDSAVKLWPRGEPNPTDSNFMIVAGERFMGREYLRGYFDMTWSMPPASDEHDDSRARRRRQFPFEFWLDKELHPDQVRAGETAQPQPNPQPNPQPTEEPTMIKITTKTLLNGGDIAEMTNEQLFDAIAQAEAEIEKCQAIKVKPKALVAKIEELQAGIVALVEHMDAKV